MTSPIERPKRKPLTFSMSLPQTSSASQAEKRREEFRKKNRVKLVDKKWLKHILKLTERLNND